MTNAEIRAMLQRVDARELRLDAGISVRTVLRALHLTKYQLSAWELGKRIPSCPAGIRWARFVAGLQRHAAVSAEIAATERRAA